MFEFNFSVMEIVHCSAICAHCTHFVVRARFDTSPKRKDTSRSVNLFRKLFQVVNRIVTKSFRFVSGMLRARSLVLMHAPN